MSGYKLCLVLPQRDVVPVEAALESVFEDGTGEGMPGIAAFENPDDKAVWTFEAYFASAPAQEKLDQAHNIAEEQASRPLPPFTAEPLPATDWVSLSQSLLDPVEAGRFFVHGAHDRDKRPSDKICLEIEAGQAFGTGRHETTATCLLALQEIKAPPRTAIDVGCGSGILSFAMLKLWPDCMLTASDLDPISVDVLRHNAGLNACPLGDGPGEIFPFCAADVQDEAIQARAPYDLITANILAAPLIDMAGRLVAILAPSGYLILSGLLQTQEKQVRTAYETLGLTLAAHRPMGEWQCLIFTRAD